MSAPTPPPPPPPPPPPQPVRHPPDTTVLRGTLELAGRLDPRFFSLLQALQSTGSLQKAARSAGYSYKGAWLLLETAANLTHAPLVQATTGGRGGGGSRLTEQGQQLLTAWEGLQQRHAAFLAEQEQWLLQQPGLAALLRRFAMKTSARNPFAGTVSAVVSGPATTQVTLRVAGGHEVTASMTSGAAERLGLEVGREAIAMVNASDVVLVTDFAGYRLSARNQLAGTIGRVQRGAVSSLVGVTLPGGSTVTASVTNDAVDALGLTIGQAATATFKAYAVMVAVAAA